MFWLFAFDSGEYSLKGMDCCFGVVVDEFLIPSLDSRDCGGLFEEAGSDPDSVCWIRNSG